MHFLRRILVSISCLLALTATVSRADVFISEFDATNIGTAADADGERPDWIEIRNSSAATNSLNGWALTDNPAVPGKWVFPDVSIEADSQILVFASGKNWAVTNAELHTNFKLGSSGTIQLSQPDGAGGWITISAITDYPAQRPGISYGRAGSELTGALGYFETPTPNVVNGGTVVTQFVADTSYSVDRGIYTTAFDTLITTVTPGATIIYTLNGSEPTLTNGTQVLPPNETTPPSATVPVATTTTLRARAVKAGLGATDIDTHTYIFPADVLGQNAALVTNRFGTWTNWGHAGPDWEMDSRVTGHTNSEDVCVADNLKAIPTVSLVMDWADIFGPSGIYVIIPTVNVKKQASFEVINPDGSVANPNLRKGGQARGNVDIFGSQIVQYKNSKQQMGFNFWTDFETDVLGDDAIGRYDKLVIDPQNQHTWLNYRADHRNRGEYARDIVMSDFQNAMGDPGTHAQAVHLYINGLYWGIYNLKERPEEHFAAAYIGGNADDWDVVKHGTGDPNFVVASQRIDPAGGTAKLNQTAYTNFLYMQALADAVGSDPGDPAKYAALAAKLDIPEFINHILLNFYANNTDWAAKNWYASFNRANPGGKWRFHEWDAELVLWGLSQNVTTANVAGGPTAIHQKLVANADYRRLFGDTAHKYLFNGGLLTPTRVQAMFDARHLDIDDAIRAESARWGDDYGSSELHLRFSNVLPSKSWMTERQFMATLINGISGGQNLTTTLIARLRGLGLYPPVTSSAPVFSQHGGLVALNYPLTMANLDAGTIYFTLDGSDPQSPDGNPGPTATIYTGAVTLTTSLTVKARVLDGSTWSALNEAYFSVNTIAAAAGNLVISKIHYHPAGPTSSEVAAGFADGSEFEFIEVMNIGSSNVILDGISYTEGLDIAPVAGGVRELVPGGRALYVAKPSAFIFRYGTNLPVAGKFIRGSNLDNGGERLHLRAADGATIVDFSYDDVSPWPTTPDGSGPSLVLINPVTSNPTNGANWRASFSATGSPGVDDSTTVIVKINEVLTHTDAPQRDTIELYNPNGSVVSLAGWYLTDNLATPQKWAVPAGTTIPANGYLTFYQGHFDPPGSANLAFDTNEFGAAFSLSATGEELYLFSPTLSYSYGFSFEGAFNGVSFGRYVTSLGEEHFPSQTSFTPDATNSGPIVGPVVITEIMYNPAVGGHEFLELANISTGPVTLYDPAFPTNTWKVGGIAFQFPTNITLGVGKIILLVRDTITTTAFRTTFGIPADVQIFSYTGNLDNGGEEITLRRPDEPVQTGLNAGEVPYVVVDRVKYDDQSPWPIEPDGTGPALERILTQAYGNDVVNWRKSSSSGGTPGFGITGPTTPLIAVSRASIYVNIDAGQTAPAETFQVWNSGTNTLNYLVQESSAMLSVLPTGGVSTGPGQKVTHTVTFTTAALAAGQHQAIITVVDNNSGASNGPIAITVTVVVNPPPAPQIGLDTVVLEPSVIAGSNATNDTFKVWNAWTGTLNYNVSDDAAWLSVTPTSGTSTGVGNMQAHTVTYATAGLAAGNYAGTITVFAPGVTNSPQTITVNLTVIPPSPGIAKDTAVLNPSVFLGSNATTNTFKVWNSGNSTLNYSVSDNAAWLSVTPTSGTSTGVGNMQAHTVTYATAGLSAGSYVATITVSAPGVTNSPQTTTVNLTVSLPTPGIAMDTAVLNPSVFVGSNATTNTFKVWNSGNSTLNYNLSVNAAWLSVTPTNGTSTGVGDPKSHTVSFNSAALLAGTYFSWIQVSAPGSVPPTAYLPVVLQVREPGGFTAYNDLSWGIGQLSNNITTHTTAAGGGGDGGGALIDYATGQPTGVRLNITGGLWNGANYYNRGTNANSGTDAYNVFNGKVNCTGVLSYEVNPLVLTFTNLSPSARYEVAVFGNRASYNDRYTTLTLEGAVSFTNTSSVGAIVSGVSNQTTRILNGQNTTTGYVARFAEINPGADGAFTLRTLPSTTELYYLNALMLRSGPSPAPRGQLYTLADGRLVLTWDIAGMVLEEAPAVTGPWTPCASQSAVQAILADQPARFFRLRSP